jgi:outer membrane receptor for ferrienterochelin and colicins
MKRVLWSGLLLSLCRVSLAHAQSNDLEALMNQSIVSTPSKDAESSTTAPATSSIITAEELRAHGLRSLNEALNYASLGMVTTTLEHGVEIGARGVLLTGDYGNHVLLLIDGVPANEPWNGTAYFERGAGVPFELVDHIEVTLGPGSVMHGAQAMLGVINIVTKRARDYRGVHLILEGDTTAPVFEGEGPRLSPLAGYGHGYRWAAGFGHSFELGGLPAELTLQLERYKQHGPDWHLTPQLYGDDASTGAPKDFGPRTPAGQWGGNANRSSYVDVPAAYARLRVGELETTLRFGMYKRESPFTTSIVNAGDDFNDPDNGERDRWLQLGASYTRAVSSRVQLSLRGYGLLNEYRWFSRRSAAEECPDGLVSGCERTLIGAGKSGGADLRASVDLPELKSTVMLGVDSRLRSARSELTVVDRVTGVVAPVDNDYTRTDALVAPYVQESFSPYRWLDANAGLRFDYDTRFGSKLSPRAALGVTPWHNGRLKAIYAEAFRGPTAYELNYADRTAQVPAPSLAAETVRSIELSIEQRFGGQRVFFGVFHSSWSDMVSYRTLRDDEISAYVTAGALEPTTSEAYIYANSGSLSSYGYNAAYEASVARKLHLAANLTSSFSRIDFGDGSGSRPLVVGPSFFGNARVSYELGGNLPTPALAAYYWARRPADRAFDGGFARAPYAPPDLQLRFTLTGVVPHLAALSYRVSTTFDAASRGPYVVGPNQYASDASTRAELSPQRRLSAFAGLEYVIQ